MAKASTTFPGFAADTLVLTERGYIPISEVLAGDRVYTHCSRWKDVIRTVSEEVVYSYELCVEGLKPIITSPTQTFRVQKNNTGRWIEAQNLTNTDRLTFCYSVPELYPYWPGITFRRSTGPDGLRRTLHKYMDNESFWWLVGAYVGCGAIKKKSRCESVDRHYAYYYCDRCHYDRIYEKALGIFIIRKETFKADKKYVKVGDREFGEFLHLCTCGSNPDLDGEKFVHSAIMNLPVNCLKAYLMGYIENTNSYIDEDGRYYIYIDSLGMVYGLQSCIAKVFGLFVPVKTIRQIQTDNPDECSYLLSFNKNGDGKSIKNVKNAGLPIKSIRKIETPMRMYKLEVTYDESYTVYNLAAGNSEMKS